MLKNYNLLRGEPMIKWWKLKDETSKKFKEKMIERGPSNINGDTKEMWNTMVQWQSNELTLKKLNN